MLKQKRSWKQPKIRRKFNCNYCSFKGVTHYQMENHRELNHLCHFCRRLMKSVHRPCPVQYGGGQPGPDNGPVDIDQTFFKQRSRSHGGILVSYSYTPKKNFTKIHNFMTRIQKPLFKLLKQLVHFFDGIKLKLYFVFTLLEVRTSNKVPDFPSGTPFQLLGHEDLIEETVANLTEYVDTNMKYVCLTKSGFRIDSINRIDVIAGRFSIPRGRGAITLPSILRRKKGLINPVTGDTSFCFQTCILIALYSPLIYQQASQELKANKKKLKRYISRWDTYIDFWNKDVDFKGINLDRKGVCLRQVDVFEENNKEIGIIVYTFKKELIQIRNTKNVLCSKIIPLLLIQDDANSNWHYLLITSVSLLISNNSWNRSICSFCSKPCKNKNTLENHVCNLEKKCVILKPKKKIYRFRRPELTLRISHVCYFQFYRIKIRNDKSWKICFVGYNIIAYCNGEILENYTYFGENCIPHFITTAYKFSTVYLNLIKATNNWIEPTDDEKEIFNASTNCDCCMEEFTSENPRTRHHHHFQGNVTITPSLFSPKLILCSNCNLKARTPYFVPVIGFCETRHDFNLISTALGELSFKKSFPISRRSGEIIGLSIGNRLRLLNGQSFRQGTTLTSLGIEMLESNKAFPTTEEFLGRKCFLLDLNEEQIEKFNSLQDFFEAVESSSAKLNFCTHHVMKKSRILCDVFENHRDLAMELFGLDPAHLYSSSRYALEAAFFLTKSSVELIENERISNLVNDGLRGGAVVLSIRKAVSNTTRFGSYNSSLPTTNLLSLDFNSQYSHALCKDLPKDNFVMLTKHEVENFDLSKVEPGSGTGYILKVKVKYNIEVHDKFSTIGFPPISERRRVNFVYKSPDGSESYQTIRTDKILNTLFDKEESVHYYLNLKLYEKLGLVFKVLDGFKFNEAKIFKSFAEFNVLKRAEAKSEMVANWLKDLNNFLVGRLCSSPMKYSKNKFVRTSAQFKRNFSQHNLKDVHPVSPTLSLFSFTKTKAQNLQFRVIALVVYELSKLELHELIHFKLYSVFGPRMTFIYSHTDSVLASIQESDKDYMQHLHQLSDVLDTSNLPSSHELYSLKNKKKMGKVKLDDGLLEFIGLKGSSYSIKYCDESTKCRASGIPKLNNQSLLQHKNYIKALETEETTDEAVVEFFKLDQNGIINVKTKRRGLNAISMDRWFYTKYHSLPLGHYKIRDKFN